MAGKTLFDKIWDSYVVRSEPDGTTLLYIDRQLVHEVPARAIALASSSPYRRELMQRLGLDFVWADPDVNEAPIAGESPADLVQRLAVSKARSLAGRFPGALIIEAMAQLGGFLLEMSFNTPGNIRALLVQVDQVKFHRFAEPGDQLEIRAELGSALEDAAKVHCRVDCRSERVAQGTLTFIMKAIDI